MASNEFTNYPKPNKHDVATRHVLPAQFQISMSSSTAAHEVTSGDGIVAMTAQHVQLGHAYARLTGRPSYTGLGKTIF